MGPGEARRVRVMLAGRRSHERRSAVGDSRSVTWAGPRASIQNVLTRRQVLLTGLAFSMEAFAAREFWNQRMPSDWTDVEIRQLLTKSPWAKEASITDTGVRGPLSSGRAAGGGGRRGGRGGGTQSPTPPNTVELVKWRGSVRWESALPVRTALHSGTPGETPAEYILNVFGDVPSGETDSALIDNTKLEHKGDQIKLTRVEPAPKNDLSPGGTLFYFSRLLALQVEDKEVTFSTKLGPLEVKCKFTLKDMLYRGKLEL
jgi:hypothetical protein